MAKPVIGIIGNSYVLNDDYPVQAAGVSNITAVSDLIDAVPLVVPALPGAVQVADLMAACDGFVFTGGRPNVHPRHYGHPATAAHGAFDEDRDAVVLPLIRACVERGLPAFGVCRGFQEFNVAMGGTLHPEIRDLPGRMNHRMPPEGTLEEKFALRHDVTFTDGGVFHKMMGATTVRVNSLHGQGIEEAGARVRIEGWAEDATPEALVVREAPGFALAVQWHPEWRAAGDQVSRVLYRAFGAAATAFAAARRGG